MSKDEIEAVVIGAGPAGLAAALALANAGIHVAVAAPPQAPGAPADTRTAALFPGSITMLENLGIWAEIADLCAPLSAIRLVDDRDALLRAPEVLFEACEIGLPTFGYNVPNAPLVTALHARCEAMPSAVTLIATSGITRIQTTGQNAVLDTAEGQQLTARLVVGADGRRSIARQSAGIETRSWAYEQSALAVTFTHSRPHNGVSTEFHRPAGPMTTVPLPGLASSLVWVERPAAAERLKALSDADFRQTLAQRLQGLLGSIGQIGPRALFPLSGLSAQHFGINRVALVGEAGHVIPPIGAQGLNLGMRDAATLADCAGEARRTGRDIGGPEVLSAYDSARRADVTSRVWSIDVLNKSLLSPFLPVHLARGLGLFALKGFAPLRRFAMREGLQPSFATPSLMRPVQGTQATPGA
ncbi:MAG: UbiH/UbiF family hydroxylase [Hyphomicrobiaceae bacterium]